MNPTSTEGTSETVPLRSPTRPKKYFIMDTLSRSFGTTYFMISSAIAAAIPLAQLAIGLYYAGECPIRQLIGTYMIVAGACGLALGGLSIFIAVLFKYLIEDTDRMDRLTKLGVFSNAVLMVILSLFNFIWFFVGCVWVFGVGHQVQFVDSTLPDYCQPVLYKGTFALLVLTVIWFLLQCCLECFRQCCVGTSN